MFEIQIKVEEDKGLRDTSGKCGFYENDKMYILYLEKYIYGGRHYGKKLLEDRTENINFEKYSQNDRLEEILMQIVEDSGITTKHKDAVQRYKKGY